MLTKKTFQLFVLLIAASSMSRADEEAGILRAAVIGEPLGTLPTLHFHAPGKILVQHLGESLVGLRNDLTIAPVLADSWAVSESGRLYTFKLRADARFHNGEKVTAGDVAANWHDLYLDRELPWDCRAYYDGSGTIEERTTGVDILSVEAIDEDTVAFRLREPNSLFLHRLADVSCAPVVFHEASFGNDGTWDRLIGTGPYRLGEWILEKSVTMTRYDDYVPRREPRDGYGGAREPLLDEIRLIVLPDAEAAVDALIAGKVDYVQNIGNDQREKVLEDPSLATASNTNITYWTLLFQTRDTVVGDETLRKAIAMSIDIDRIAQAISGNRLSGNASVVSGQSRFFSEDQSRRIPFAPASARRLIEESDYAGEVIRIQAARNEYPELFTIAVMAQAMMRDVGLNAELLPMTWHELKDVNYMNGSYQMQAFIIGGRTSPTLAYGKFIGSKDNLPRFYWDNHQAFSLLSEAERATSVRELQSVYDQLHRMMIEDIPQIVIGNREQHDAFRINVTGIQPTHFGRIAFWGVSKNP